MVENNRSRSGDVVSIYIPKDFRDTWDEFNALILIDKSIDVNNTKEVNKPEQLRSLIIRKLIKAYVLNRKRTNQNETNKTNDIQTNTSSN